MSHVELFLKKNDRLHLLKYTGRNWSCRS